MRKLAFALFLLCLSTELLCQITPCASYFQTSLTINENSFTRSKEILFPVVVHIISTEDSPDISNVDITNLLRLLNNDFNSLADIDFPNLDEVGSTTGRVGFGFKLAQLDPDGNATTAILRKSTDIQDIGNSLSNDQVSPVKSDAAGGSDPWDVENYINIWIAERSISLGATVAENTQYEDVEGMVLSFDAVLDFPKTISHEMGHYFGLLHPWGNSIGCDDEEDGINDTPFQEAPNFDCQSVINCGIKTLPGNIMDFSSDDCLLYFTKLQANHMQNFAQEFKGNLIQSEDCFFNNFS